jgi:hypothetical protein
MSAYLLHQVWDRISLQFALRHGADGVIAPLPTAQGRGELRCTARGRFTVGLEPYPLVRDTVEIPVVASLVPDRAYTDPEDFMSTLAAAGQTVIECIAVR